LDFFRRQAWSTYFDEHDIRVIFYSALQSAPTTKKIHKIEEEKETFDDTEKLLEELKREQTDYNDDNLEISKSPSKLNRFDALNLEDEVDDKQKAEINLNDEDNQSSEEEEDDDDDDEEEDEEEDVSEDEEDIVEQIREDILAYEQLKETQRKNLSLIVNREELIYLLKCFYTHKATVRENVLTIGMVK